MPKPYNGIHPKALINSIIKNSCIVNSKPVNLIHIPNRDLENYDSLIPSFIAVIPALAYGGTILWN